MTPYAARPVCDPCRRDDHAACEVFVCHCLHAACPTEAQMTIDDALSDPNLYHLDGSRRLIPANVTRAIGLDPDDTEGSLQRLEDEAAARLLGLDTNGDAGA